MRVSVFGLLLMSFAAANAVPALDQLTKAITDLVIGKDPVEASLSLEKIGLAQRVTAKHSNVTFAKNKAKDSYLPVIQMHGMGDFANDPGGMVPLKNAISDYLGGVYVLNVQIGVNSIADIMNGFIMNLDDQVDYFANVVKNDPNLADGFNAVGYSQGNLVIRGYIEKYNDPKVHNFISVHGPLAGVGAFPGCSISHEICKLLSEVLGALAYFPAVQEHLAQANYFRDPLKIDSYLAGDKFLADINNERSATNAAFAANWESLESVCLVKALGDTVVVPNDSEWFGFFKDGTFKEVWAFEDTPWYSKDLFGLKTLHSSGRVFFNTTDGNHLDFETDYLLNLVGLYFM